MKKDSTLQMVLDKQREFQSRFGFKGEETDLESLSSLIHTHSHFLNEETIEMLRELPFHKPWKDYSDWDPQKMADQFEIAREEWIDMFIFLMNVGLFLGFDEELIKQMYLEKLGINHKRQDDPTLGYVGGVH
jgi:hypothetical protein